jgi:hypothetical protein
MIAPGTMRSLPLSFGRRSAQMCPATVARHIVVTRA